jgi:hypothetical protein
VALWLNGAGVMPVVARKNRVNVMQELAIISINILILTVGRQIHATEIVFISLPDNVVPVDAQ